MEERSFHPLDYTSVVRRRKWWFIAPLALSIVVGGVLAMVLPREYTSEAEIGIADPTLSPDLVRGVQSLDAQERQRAISQQLLSRTVLERVVREENLSSPGKPIERTVAALRANVEQHIVVPQPIGRMGPNREGANSFRLGYVDATAERAQRIANRLATVFVEENSKSKAQQAQNTSEVLASQVKASHERLAKLQEQLRVKKQANIGRLPDQMNANVAMVNGLRQQHESLSLQFRTEQDRLALIEGQLEQMKQGAGGILTSSAQSAIQSAQARVNDLERQLRQYQANGYTEQHPDIIATKEELTIARRELTSIRQQTPGGGDDLLVADATYRQKVNERDAARLRVATLRRQMSQALAQIAAYQSRVDSAPLVEQELASLVQEESLERKRYESLSDQYQRAQVAEDVTRKQGGERFVVLNPAYLPTRPTSPNLLRLMAMAIALGLVLGVAAVIGREFLDRSVHDARVLQNEFEVPVLGEIPRIHA